MELNEALKIYKFPFFNDKQMVNFVKSVLHKEREMIVTTPLKNKFSKKKICDSIKNRVPVYFGDVKASMFNYKIPNYQQPFGIKYAICGKSYLKQGGHFYSIHTWGVNFESDKTTDYKNIVKNNKIQQKKYRSEVKKMLECIVKAKEYYDLSKVYLPLIGLGAYLSAISFQEKEIATKIFFEEISKTDLIAVIINRNVLSDSLHKNYKKNIEIGNLFTPRKGNYGVVNAWDSDSFIGNGGSQDETIDGWYVAGFGPNKNLKNSSFLHNYMFNPNLCDKIV